MSTTIAKPDRRSFLGWTAALSGAATLGGCATPRVVRPGAAKLSRIGELARMAIDKKAVAGCTIQIGDARGLIHAETHGMADLEAGVALRPDHLHRVYSMTKPVTSVAALILHEAGALDLNAPVARYIPAFAGVQVLDGGTLTAPGRPVTVRDLMRHTAGLIYRGGEPKAVGALYEARGISNGSGEPHPPTDGSPAPATLEAMIDRLAGIPLVAQPGTRFTYGNATDVLGRVVEVASGKRLSAFMDQAVFKPLDMKDSAFHAVDPQRLTAAYLGLAAPREQNAILDRVDVATIRPGALRLIDPPAASPFARPRPIDFGGAGLVCTAGDYLTFARMLGGRGTVDGRRILSRASVDLMATNALPEEALANPGLRQAGVGFGLGASMFVDPAKVPDGVPKGCFFWGGAASTFQWSDPENGVGGVIMGQVFGGDFRAWQIPLIQAFYQSA